MRQLIGSIAVALFSLGGVNAHERPVVRALAHPPREASYGAIEQTFDGPGLVCGEAFGLILKRGERLTRRDPRIDFLTYRIDGPNGAFVLYEGNAPQPHDDEIQTGLQFPSVIAIHDNRSASKKRRGRIKDRLITGTAQAGLCGQGAEHQ